MAAVVKTATEAVALAAQAIGSVDRNLKLAAEYCAFAADKGMTQRQIAAGVGKSPAWVNRLLAWRSEGFADDTPFGPSNAEQRERAKERVQPTEQESEDPDLEARRKQRERDRRERERQRIHAEAERIAAERVGALRGLSESDRRRLVGCLGLLGSDKDGEVLAAARKTEEIRRRLNLSWGDLIVLAAEQEIAA